MVTDAVLGAVITAVVFVIGLFPDAPPEVSTGLAGFSSNVASVVETISKLGPIIPFEQISLSIFIMTATWAFCLIVQSLRFALSAFIGGGGTV